MVRKTKVTQFLPQPSTSFIFNARFWLYSNAQFCVRIIYHQAYHMSHANCTSSLSTQTSTVHAVFVFFLKTEEAERVANKKIVHTLAAHVVQLWRRLKGQAAGRAGCRLIVACGQRVSGVRPHPQTHPLLRQTSGSQRDWAADWPATPWWRRSANPPDAQQRTWDRWGMDGYSTLCKVYQGLI